jgi:hypothetical protein
MQRYGGAITAAALFSAAGGAGMNNMAIMPEQLMCGQFVSDGIGGIVNRQVTGWQVVLPLTQIVGQPNFMYPTWMRLWRWQFMVRFNGAANAAYATYIGLSTFDGVLVNTIGPDGAGGRFFGIGGDGAGNWQWQSKRAGILGAFAETLALGIPCTQLTVFDLVMLAATGASNAVCQLYVNGVQRLARQFIVGGTVLPDYALQANSVSFVPMIGARDPAVALTMQVGPMRFMTGHYQVSGAEV